MSLYGDLENEEQEEKKPAWEANLKLLQSHIQLKKATLTQQRDKGRPPLAVAGGEHSKKRVEVKQIVAETIFMAPQERNAFFEDLQVEDEYNPLYPNDYEKIAKKRDEERQKRKEEERRKAAEERERRKKERYDSESRRSDDEEEDDDRRWRQEKDRRTAGAAIAPPPSLATDSAASTEEAEMPSGGFAKPVVATSKGLNVAAKIMEKYGYRQGGGLGKQEQGMSTALLVEKTGLRGGKIIHEKDTLREIMMPPPFCPPESGSLASDTFQAEESAPPITDLLKNPTKVVLIRNMVGPGEVDDELDGETKEEMSKYGDVVNVMIYEIPDAVPEEAVRIFVEYPKIDQAIKALVALNGRFFGGRSIRATFYNYEKYKTFELSE